MNKKLTREEAIKLHRKMWQDMQVELGDDPKWDKRLDFKKKWVEEHFPNEHVISNCFLCEYANSTIKEWLGLDSSRCDKCPIAWNSSVQPCCSPGIFAIWERNEVDYRFSPISVVLALPEREVENE